MKILFWIIRQFKTITGEFKNEGFNPKEVLKQIKEDGDHYSAEGGELEIKLGAALKVTAPDGQHDVSKMIGEIQRNKYFDTFGCTIFNTENPIQIMMINVYGIIKEFTERYNGVLANIKIGFGGSPHTAGETVRKYGLLDYNLLPFDDSITTPQQYYSPKPMTQELINEGKKWLNVWKFGHDWIWDFSRENIMKMLTYSPLGIGVYAGGNWSSGGIITKPNWATDNHWTTLIGYKKGEYWIVYDSYEVGGSFIKHLDWNYDFKFAKRYTLDKIGSVESTQVEEGQKLHDRLKGKYILRAEKNGEMYRVAEDSLVAVSIYISDKKMRDEFNAYLRSLPNFIGVSEKDFNNLSQAVIVGNGVVEKFIDISSLINNK